MTLLKTIEVSHPHSSVTCSLFPAKLPCNTGARYYYANKLLQELSELDKEVPERAAASTSLETAFLICLCSAEISTCKLVTRCISLFCEETILIEKATGSSKSSVTTLRNVDVYAEISARDFRLLDLWRSKNAFVASYDKCNTPLPVF